MSICKYCGKTEFKNRKAYGAHLTNCISNPNRQNRINKLIKVNTIKRIDVIKTCPKCKIQFKVTGTEREFETNRVRRFCSFSCANKKQPSQETRQKISASLKGKHFGHAVPFPSIDRKCKVCDTIMHIKIYSIKQTCSHKCFLKLMKAISVGKNKGNKNGMFGISPSPHNYKHGIFISKRFNKTIHYKSSYEKRALEKIENDMSIINYQYEPYKILYENGNRSTIPDFLINYKDGTSKIVEVKPKSLLNIWNNKCKLNVMQKYCIENNIEFNIWTEEDL